MEDVETIVQQRRAMFFDMGHRDEAALDSMCHGFRPWLKRQMEDGHYLAWFAMDEGQQVAAGLGLWLMDWPPHMIGGGSRRGNILNVYTRPASRRQGLARSLMLVALQWCRDHGIATVILHASKEGRGVYEKLGFQSTNEMRIIL